ncbi:endonuclease VII domain-containing protein [Actinoplanes sp. NBC_00393]|uniref:endonuclease VII domain-containing protein n=1 Tax=Actinoplanes sp. NBC_00393 TaxID=2975953 RepID=UPI002E2039AE
MRPSGPEAIRAANRWKKYRITPQQDDALCESQHYRCKICGIHENDIRSILTGRPRLDGEPTAEPVRLVVDHCHDSQRVRGLLCNSCNAMIGQARDRPEVLRAGADYLEAPRGSGPRLTIL